MAGKALVSGVASADPDDASELAALHFEGVDV
jgi:hypothetical protein